MLLHGETICTIIASAHWLRTTPSVRALLKFLPLAAPAEDNRAAGTGMGLGGILERRATIHASLLTDTDGAGAIGLLRATSRRLGGLGPRLLPHDARQATPMQRQDTKQVPVSALRPSRSRWPKK